MTGDYRIVPLYSWFNISKRLVEDYFKSFDGTKYLKASPQIETDQLAAYAAELLPAVEHNPIIEFRLRPNVKFHDGHVLDAGDVKFTYEAILNPKNLSPRIADYEPVKMVKAVDPHTIRIVYKRLYSPAVGT